MIIEDSIYQASVLYTRTIPSIFNFFQDWKYIQICFEVLIGLLAIENQPIHRSLKKCFELLFHRPEHMVVQIDHQAFLTCLLDPLDCFRLAYW
jgi:hypothetical protein